MNIFADEQEDDALLDSRCNSTIIVFGRRKLYPKSQLLLFICTWEHVAICLMLVCILHCSQTMISCQQLLEVQPAQARRQYHGRIYSYLLLKHVYSVRPIQQHTKKDRKHQKEEEKKSRGSDLSLVWCSLANRGQYFTKLCYSKAKLTQY